MDFIVFKATKWERFASEFFPYHLPFINKRTRVKIKWYFKYKWCKRASKCLVKLLSTAECTPIGKFKINEDEWFWDVIQ